MDKKYLPIIVITFLLFTIISNLTFVRAETNIEDRKYETLTVGQYDIKHRVEEVIDNQNDLEQYINNTNVNFDTHKVAVIALGEKNTGGYSIEIEDIVEKDDKITVNYKEVEPEGHSIDTETYPSKIISVETNGREININNTGIAPSEYTVQNGYKSGDGWNFYIEKAEIRCRDEETGQTFGTSEYMDDDYYAINIAGKIITDHKCYDITIDDVQVQGTDFTLKIDTVERQNNDCEECEGVITYGTKFRSRKLNIIDFYHGEEHMETVEHNQADYDSDEEIKDIENDTKYTNDNGDRTNILVRLVNGIVTWLSSLF